MKILEIIALFLSSILIPISTEDEFIACNITKVDAVAESGTKLKFISSEQWFWILDEKEKAKASNARLLNSKCPHMKSVNMAEWIKFNYNNKDCDETKEVFSNGRLLLFEVSWVKFSIKISKI